jgi:FlaA1/EpsC-like NDP-sugar epimerase
MTRFWITLAQGVAFVTSCAETMRGGEVFVPKIPSMNIMDLAAAIAPGCQVEPIGIRPGEKLHEVLISEDESRCTRDAGDRFVMLQPYHPVWVEQPDDVAKPVEPGFRYSSDNNPEWLGVEDLKRLIDEE